MLITLINLKTNNMIKEKTTTAKQDSDARQALFSKTPAEKEVLKAAKSLWKKSNSNKK
jgi:hypothetical protein